MTVTKKMLENVLNMKGSSYEIILLKKLALNMDLLSEKELDDKIKKLSTAINKYNKLKHKKFGIKRGSISRGFRTANVPFLS